MAEKDRKLTQEQRDEIVELYFEGDEYLTHKELGERYGVSARTIWSVLHNEGDLTRYHTKVKVRKLRAEIILTNNAEKAARKMTDMIDMPVPDNMLFVNQNAARDVLDRNGLRAKKEEDLDITIKFGDSGMPAVGMPPASEEQEDTGDLSGGDQP